MIKRIFVLFVFLLIFITSCSSKSTETPIIPTSTPLPEKVPPQMQIWDGFTAKVVCLESELDYGEYISSKNIAVSDPIDETVKKMLEGMGIEVVEKGSECDATLFIEYESKVFCPQYEVAGSCCTGGEVYAKFQLTAKGKETFKEFIVNEQEPAVAVLEGVCEKYEDYKLIKIWRFPLVRIMYNIWGDPAIIWSLDIVHATDVIELFYIDNLSDDGIQALIYALYEDDYTWDASRLAASFPDQTEMVIPHLIELARDPNHPDIDQISQALGKYGPRAIEAVPVLIEVMKTHKHKKEYMDYHRTYEAIKLITGNDFGHDYPAWEKWWEKQQ